MVAMSPTITGFTDFTDSTDFKQRMNGALKKQFSGIGYHFARNVVKGFVKAKLKDVRPDQLWTQIQSGIPPEEIWDRDFGSDLPEGTVNLVRGVAGFSLAKSGIEDMAKVLQDDDLALEEVEGILREVRPDLYRVLLTTPGGRSLLAAATANMRLQFEQMVAEIRVKKKVEK